MLERESPAKADNRQSELSNATACTANMIASDRVKNTIVTATAQPIGQRRKSAGAGEYAGNRSELLEASHRIA